MTSTFNLDFDGEMFCLGYPSTELDNDNDDDDDDGDDNYNLDDATTMIEML